jgi:hypothetical protein
MQEVLYAPPYYACAHGPNEAPSRQQRGTRTRLRSFIIDIIYHGERKLRLLSLDADVYEFCYDFLSGGVEFDASRADSTTPSPTPINPMGSGFEQDAHAASLCTATVAPRVRP